MDLDQGSALFNVVSTSKPWLAGLCEYVAGSLRCCLDCVTSPPTFLVVSSAHHAVFAMCCMWNGYLDLCFICSHVDLASRSCEKLTQLRGQEGLRRVRSNKICWPAWSKKFLATGTRKKEMRPVSSFPS